MRKYSIRTVFMLSAVAVILLSGTAIGYLSLLNTRNAVESVAAELRREIADRVVDHLRGFLAVPQGILNENARLFADGIIDVGDAAILQRHFLKQTLIHPFMTSLYLGNLRGGLAGGGHDGRREVLYTIGTDGFAPGTFRKFGSDSAGNRTRLIQSLPDYDARTRGWYRSAIAADGVVWGDIYILFTGQDMALPPSLAVRDASGRLLGVVGGDIFVSQISRFLADLHRRTPGQTIIMESDGRLVASSTGELPFTLTPEGRPGRRLGAADSADPVIKAGAAMILGNGAVAAGTRILEAGGDRHFIEVTPFHAGPGLSWLIATIVPQSHYMGAVEAGNRRAVVLIILSMAVMALVTWGLARWILHPLAQLTESVDAVAQGDLSRTIGVERADEIGILARSFNAMSAAIRTQRDELRLARDVLEARVAARTRDIRKLSLALEQSHNMVMITDLDGAIEYVNPAFTRLTGYQRSEVIGANPRILKSDDTPPETYVELWRTITAGREWRCELKDRRRDGSHFWASVLISPVKDDGGAITHFVAMHEDVTERHEAEHRLRLAREQADLANRAKSELMANMSHELRTPLNAIIGFSEALLHGTFGPLGSDRNREYVQDIQSSGQHLLDLINDILDVAAIEAGRIELHDEDLDVGELVAAMVRMVRPKAEWGGVDIQAAVAAPAPRLRADRRRIKQILLNLLTNAVKFTPRGGRVVIGSRLSSDARVVITVEDSGIGMDEAEIAIALTQFGQVDSGLNRKHEGTGLGLPLTRGLAEMHGAALSLASVKGKGTTVTVIFPPERTLPADGMAS